MDLYHMEMSGPCQAVRLVARALDLKLNLIYVDLDKEEQLKPEFVKINPQHVIPTLVDNGFVLWESRAILAYLCENTLKTTPCTREIPKNGPSSTSGCTSTWERSTSDLPYTTTRRFSRENLPPKVPFKQFEDALQFLETFLTCSEYLAGDSLTIADISLLVTGTTFKVAAGLDLAKYANIERWYELVAKSVAGHDEICVQGSKQFAPYFVNAKQ